MPIVYMIIALSIIPFTSKAQLDTVRFIRENGKIEAMDNFVGLKLSMNNNIEIFLVDTDGADFDLYPNTKTLTSINFNYRFLSFTISFAPPFFPGNKDDELKGKTRNFNIGTGLNFRHWFHNLSYSRVKGFYLNNSSEFPVYIPGGPYLQVPDLVITNFQGTTGYSFNPAFSVKSLTTQTERQIKSAGSFIPLVGYRYYIVNNTDPNASSSQKSNNLEFSIAAGYHYTIVIKKNVYFSAGLTPGIGIVSTKLTTRFSGSPDIVTKSHSPLIRYDARVATGFNGRAFFAGGIMNLTGSSFEQEGTTAINSDTRITYQIFVGCRINAPKKLRNGMDVIDSYRKW